MSIITLSFLYPRTPDRKTHKIIVLTTIFLLFPIKKWKPVNHKLSPFLLYAFYPPPTGIICLLLSLQGPGKYCYFGTLQPLSCSTSLRFHWIKAKCVFFLPIAARIQEWIINKEDKLTGYTTTLTRLHVL